MLRTSIAALLLTLALPLRAEFVDLPPAQLQAILDRGVPIIDVRTAPEWRQTGVVEGSHLMTFFDERGRYDVEKWMAEFSKVASPEQPVILICRSGNRTGQIGRFLDNKMGYQQIYHVAGGIKAWLRQGNQPEKLAAR